MCGIVGYVGGGAVSEILLAGLKNLEYRGYDSAGIALNDNGRIDVFKAPGKLGNLCAAAAGKADKLPATGGIGHIRWATHGKATVENAHPHLSNDGRLALVHNGIIENYKSLREELEQEGYVFSSETDTEAAVHLFEREYKKSGSLEAAVTAGVRRLKGAFAFCVMHQNEPDKIIAVRQNAPLIVGLGKDENYVASDIPAIVGKVRRIIYLNDGEIAVITRNEAKIYDFDGCPIERQPEYIGFNPEVISKRGYPHFMLKEIFEQPDCIRDCMRGRINVEANNVVLSAVIDYKEKLLNAKRFVIVAWGTSWHAGLIGKHLIESFCRIPVEVEYASEFRYRDPVIDGQDVVIAISQSGETADTLAAVELAKSRGAFIYGICNAIGSSIPRATHTGSYIHVGPEIGVASTKAFTGQVTVLAMLALTLAKAKGTIDEQHYLSIVQELNHIPEKMKEVLELNDTLAELSKTFTYAHNFIYLGRGYSYPVALEGALKLKEISYIHAEGYPAAEMKHGPIALIDAEMPVVVIATQNGLYEKVLSNIQEIKARKGKVIAFVTKGDTVISKIADCSIELPETIECLDPLITTVPLQLLAYHIAVCKGMDVDQPRNLAKSVTVE